MLLSKKRRSDTRVVTATCAQCHLRGGRSRSTGLPYPNNFVAGDNLFQDFEVDWRLADDATLNPGDRHVYRSVRDVMLASSPQSCLACHNVHNASSEKHRKVLNSAICQDCHIAGRPRKELVAYQVHSAVCEY